MFNPYLVYTYSAQELSNSCNDKILVDINRLNSINEYDDVIEYVNKIWGNVDGEATFDYPNDIKVLIRQNESCIEIGAFKKEKQFFGYGWRLK